MAISECDFFDISFNTNQKKFTRQSIEDAIHLPGYDVIFPKQWDKYGHARMIVLVKTDLAIKIVNCPTIEELPVVVVEVGTIREPKIRVAFVYREYTNYISGLNSMESQEERLDEPLKPSR